MKMFGLGLASYYILSTHAFAREVLPEQATQYSCSNSLQVFQFPYKVDGKARSLWFKIIDSDNDGTFDENYSQAVFAEGFWNLKYEDSWESTVRFVKDGYVELEAVCQNIGQGCTLKFSSQSDFYDSDEKEVTCKETPYSPKYQNIELEMDRSDELGGLKFQGLLWDIQGYQQLHFDDFRVGNDVDWKRYLISINSFKRYGPMIAFTMGTTTHFGSCTEKPEEFCSSGESLWPDVNVLLSEKGEGIYEGSYYPVMGPSGEKSGKMIIRPR